MRIIISRKLSILTYCPWEKDAFALAQRMRTMVYTPIKNLRAYDFCTRQRISRTMVCGLPIVLSDQSFNCDILEVIMPYWFSRWIWIRLRAPCFCFNKTRKDKIICLQLLYVRHKNLL